MAALFLFHLTVLILATCDWITQVMLRKAVLIVPLFQACLVCYATQNL